MWFPFFIPSVGGLFYHSLLSKAFGKIPISQKLFGFIDGVFFIIFSVWIGVFPFAVIFPIPVEILLDELRIFFDKVDESEGLVRFIGNEKGRR
jgi:hypothetical protein